MNNEFKIALKNLRVICIIILLKLVAGTGRHLVHAYMERDWLLELKTEWKMVGGARVMGVANAGGGAWAHTWFGEAETVDPLRKVVDTHVLRLAAILEELLPKKEAESQSGALGQVE